MRLLWMLFLCRLAQSARMDVVHSWSQVDFVFPYSVREQYLASGKFVPKNVVIIDVDFWRGSANSDPKIFVTLPKLKAGSPVTLATVTNQTLNNVTLLQPYPDWSWHQGDCDGITSVYRTAVDECGRLWVLDSGIVEAFSSKRRQCPPQILVFDLHTDKLIRRHRFSNTAVKCGSVLITIAVDTRDGDCGCSFAYVADVDEYGLVVYDFAKDKSWRVSSSLFYPHPLHGDFHINGVDFQLMDGVFGLALGPVVGGDRKLYFHSLASWIESWVSTSVLRNGSRVASDPTAFHALPECRRSAAACQAVTARGVLLFSLPEKNAIGCWNTRMPYSDKYMDIVAKDDVTLQFQSGLKVYGDHVWTVSNRLQNYIAGKVAENEVNIRINKGRVSDLVKNSNCEPANDPKAFKTDSNLSNRIPKLFLGLRGFW